MPYRSCRACAFQNMFANAQDFNQPLDSFDTSRVTNMQVRSASHHQPTTPHTALVSLAVAAECGLTSVALSTVSSLCASQNMFHDAFAVNQPLDSFDTSLVTDMKVRSASCCHLATVFCLKPTTSFAGSRTPS